MTILSGANFIGGIESTEGFANFSSMSPVELNKNLISFAEATEQEINRALECASKSVPFLTECSEEVIADFLIALSNKITKEQKSLIDLCHQETGLSTVQRLHPEVKRTTNQLELFANLVRTRKASNPKFANNLSNRQNKQDLDLRSFQIGIGPVLVVEASNFPLAFGVLGGDFASALAAGCPIICKAHPNHPGTSEMLARMFYETAEQLNIPKSIYSLIHGGPDICQKIVKHPLLRGIGFTGSRKAGQAILAASQKRSRPLDEISLEMGSVNPVFFYPGSFGEKSKATAEQLAQSILLGAGQFCTNPGLLIGPFQTLGREFLNHLARTIRSAPTSIMLSPKIAQNFQRQVDHLRSIPKVQVISESASKSNLKLEVHPIVFLASPQMLKDVSIMREEIFGPATILIDSVPEDFPAIADLFTGELTATIRGDNQDWNQAYELVRLLQQKVGRIIFNGVPTGVEICASMNHGGPWPAAFGRFTSVGSNALNRWTRQVCFQNAPNKLLPPVLRQNP